MKPSSQFRILANVFVLTFLVMTSAASAQTLFWTNPFSGAYNDAGNWSQGFVPESDDDVAFVLPNIHDVLFFESRTVASLLVDTDSKPTFRIGGNQSEDRTLHVETDLRIDGLGQLRLGGGSGSGRFRLMVDDAVVVNGNDLAPTSGILTIENDSYLSSLQGVIGQSANSFGSMRLTGDLSKWDVANALWIGDQSDGELRIEAGASVNGSQNFVGSGQGTMGSVFVDGIGSDGEPSSWISSAGVILGNDGFAELTITNGAVVEHGYVEAAIQPDSRAKVLVSGTDSAGNPSTWITGTFDSNVIQGGSYELLFENGAMVHSNNVGIVGQHVPDVQLRGMGPNGEPTMWIVDGYFQLGFGSNTEMVIEDGAHLQTNLVTIGNTSGDAAFLTMDVRDSLEVTSTWNNSGDVFVGGNQFQEAGQAGLELRDKSRVEIGGTLTIWAPGYFYSYNSVLIADQIDQTHGGDFDIFEGSVVQFNRYDGDLSQAGGTLSPGVGAVPSTIIGDYTQLVDASILFEIGGPAGMHDALTVTGLADVNGSIEMRLANGFVPQASDTFTVFAAGSFIGILNNVANGQRLDLADGSGSFVVNYGLGSQYLPNQIVLSDFEGSSFVLGDVNGDGEVNLLDVEPFVDLLANSGFIPEADINQDGSVDLLDVEPFVDLLAS